jgi:phosphatidylinositol N-acetylglucosaminyltransferase subunit A
MKDHVITPMNTKQIDELLSNPV